MTEEGINDLGIPDTVQHEGFHIRRNSSGKIGSLSGGMKIHSRYLRPSLGSCHDFCKYGAEHALEMKATVCMPVLKEVTETLAEGNDPKRTGTSAEGKKNLAIRVKSFPGSKAKRLDVPIVNAVVSSLTTEETILSEQEQVSSPLKETDLSVNHASDPKKKPKGAKKSSLRVQICSSGEVQGEEKLKKSKEMGSLSVNSPEFSSSKREGEAKRSEEMRSLVKSEREPSSFSLSPKHSLKISSSHNVESFNNVRKVSHLKTLKKVRKPRMPQQYSSLDVREKTLHVEPKSEKKIPNPLRNEMDVIGLSPPSSPSPKAKSSKPGQSGSHTAQFTRHSHNRIHATHSPASPREKGLRVSLLGNRTSRSYASSSLASFSTQSDASSEHDEIDSERQTSSGLKINYNNKPKGKTISLNDKCNPGKKLTFRRGKVVDIQIEDSSPKWLKFKLRHRERMLGDSQNGKGDANRKTVGKKEFDTTFSTPFSEKRNFRRAPLVSLSEHRETDTNTKNQLSDLDKEYKNTHEMDGTTNLKEECDQRQQLAEVLHSEDCISSPRKHSREKVLDNKNQRGKGGVSRKTLGKKKVVDGGEARKASKKLVLRHQDVEEKNSSSLFNNVIEETVSKLVGSSKSKVKALVGAFETVISLQDTKPLVTATAS
ncbi:Calmodulin-binding domain [Melia azedarach]|uniref:Calmodulin-binding domain n=1 Tax=Melia azedarach TaxID=155640 RepID=A0ACC1XS42_MELAZ|nr:Calmodulin-binding domain [Melia azedarach]